MRTSVARHVTELQQFSTRSSPSFSHPRISSPSACLLKAFKFQLVNRVGFAAALERSSSGRIRLKDPAPTVPPIAAAPILRACKP